MAKKGVQQASSKMTVLLLQLEGEDATLQEGFRTISAAVSRLVPHDRRAIPAPHVARSLPAPVQGEFETELADFEETAPASVVPEKVPRRNPGHRSPEVLDLDLTSGDMPLKSFLQSHPAEEIQKRYLLIAYWFKHQRSIEDVSMDHIHTGFRQMDWRTPTDAAQPLRDMKSKHQWFHKGEKRGLYRINHIGENAVMEIMQAKT